MTTPLQPLSLTFSPDAVSPGAVERQPASPGSAARFEQLFYAPTQPSTSVSLPNATDAVNGGGLRKYAENLSARWNDGQSTLGKMTEQGQFTSKELIMAQVQMIHCALDVEVASKCASIFENGVQTLIQRGS